MYLQVTPQESLGVGGAQGEGVVDIGTMGLVAEVTVADGGVASRINIWW
jgi:hypothetical protein